MSDAESTYHLGNLGSKDDKTHRKAYCRTCVSVAVRRIQSQEVDEEIRSGGTHEPRTEADIQASGEHTIQMGAVYTNF